MIPRCELTIIRLLAYGITLDKDRAAHLAFCDQKTAQRILSDLHDRLLARIAGWKHSKGSAIPVYAVANGTKDVKKPEPLTADRTEYQRSRRKNSVIREIEAERKRIKRKENNLVSGKHTMWDIIR